MTITLRESRLKREKEAEELREKLKKEKQLKEHKLRKQERLNKEILANKIAEDSLMQVKDAYDEFQASQMKEMDEQQADFVA